MDAKTVIERQQASEHERNRYQSMFDDCIRLTMPGRARFNETDPTASMDDIFDETGANGVQEFVSRMQSGLTPNFTQFLKLEASSLVKKADRDAVNRDLEEITEFAFEEIWGSNFAQESAESMLDLCMSTGVMNVEDQKGIGLLNRAIPITEFTLERGANDTVGGIFRKRKIKANQIMPNYPMARIPPEMKTGRDITGQADKELTIIEYTYQDYSAGPFHYRHYVVVKDHNEVIVERKMQGMGADPFVAFRWSTAAGEVWGRGPLLNAMAAIRTTNLMVELVLENAAMSIVGIYQTDNDGVVNADNVNLLPGTILTKEIGTRGLEQIAGASGNFNMSDVVLNDQRLNIKRALFNDMLSDPNKTPATATEVVERMADLSHRTASGFARVFYEFLVPYMRRVLYILEKRGDIQLPVLNGKAIKFRAVSPIAQSQYGVELQALAQDFQMRSMLHGQYVAGQSYEFDEIHPWLQKRFGTDERLYKKSGDIKTIIKNQAEALMQAQQQGTVE